MKKFCVLLLVLITTCFISAAEVVPLKDLERPGLIAVDKDQLFVNDGATIYIYSLKDFTLQAKFGKKGEGPQEFKVHPNINRGGVYFSVQPDYILACSIGRVSFFKRDGKYMKEMTVKSFFGQYVSVGKQYVGLSIQQDDTGDYVVISFYNSKFERGKEVFRVNALPQGEKLNAVTLLKTPIFFASSDRIYVNDWQGTLHIFDMKGNKLSAVKYDYPEVMVTNDVKKEFENFFKTDFRFKDQYEGLKQMIEFPKSFPLILTYYVADEKIYVVTYKEKEGQKVCFILDKEGKLIKKSLLPIHDMSPIELYPYCINSGKLYELIDNSDTEEWELHITVIK